MIAVVEARPRVEEASGEGAFNNGEELVLVVFAIVFLFLLWRLMRYVRSVAWNLKVMAEDARKRAK